MDYSYYQQPPTYDDSAAKKRTNRVGLAFFVLMVASTLAAIILQLAFSFIATKNGWASASPDWFGWAVTILSLYGFAAPFAYLILLTVPASPPTRRPITARAFFIFTMIAFLFMIAGSFVGQQVNNLIEVLFHREQGSQISEALENSTLWLTCVYTLGLAPLLEELFFRKLLIDRLAPLGGWVAILTSGIFFGLFHGNIDQFFYAAFLGMLLAYIYLNTGNLLYPIILHAIINFFGGIFPTIVSSFTPDFFGASTEESLEALIAGHPIAYLITLVSYYLPFVFAFVGAILLVLYWRSLSQSLRAMTPCPIPREARFRVTVLNPGVILFVLSCLLSILSVILFL